MNQFVKTDVLGVGITTNPKKEILEYLSKKMTSEAQKFYVVTPNPELLVIADEDKKYKKILNGADISLPDGAGVVLAGKILGKSLKRRISGVDFVQSLCKEMSKRGQTAGFLGGKGGVAEKTAECLKKRNFGLKISFFGPELGVYTTNPSKFPKTDMLFVAFGSPKQEILISNYIKKLPVKAMMGVGGAFDFISGEVGRAPLWVRSLGFEWLYRLISQPWRAKRQLKLIKFLFLVLKGKFGHN